MDLLTWNMQGAGATTEQKWQTGVNNLLNNIPNSKPDYLCLQEAGGVPKSAGEPKKTVEFDDPVTKGKTRVEYYSWEGHGFAFHNWDTEAGRVNTVVLTRSYIDPAQVQMQLVWATSPQWRPAVGLWTGGSWIFSFHAISPGGPDVESTLTQVVKAAGTNAWMLGGDFNREPGTFKVPAGSVWEPVGNTYSVSKPTKKYDYFASAIPSKGKGGVVDSIRMSDHYPALFRI